MDRRTKDGNKVLNQVIKESMKEIIAKVSEEMNIRIVNGVISADHLYILVSIPPNIAVSEFVQRAKALNSLRIQLEFPELKKRYWGKHCWGRGYFSTTSGHITDEVINEYINNHTEAHKPTSISNIRLG
ncbi:MAG: IS200/IS605 family transposase [Rickettsia endosymbiont of Bryobia graminum]|nr:IS200/IS605 family transposase [Rickettsia endosymbiont of Bryobia graminum]